VQVILPIALVCLVGHALWMLWFPAGSLVYAIFNVVLSVVGVAFVAVMIGIAVYGFINRRRLIGYLAVDHLPGS
jgi:hypothetical protein